MTMTETADAETRTPYKVATEIIGRLAGEHFGTGPLADLRRMNPRVAVPSTPALHRLLARHVDLHWLNGEGLTRWALLVHLVALISPLTWRPDSPSLGKALFAAGYKDGRLTALLEADEADFPVVLPRMMRFLAAKQASPQPYQLIALVLFGGREADRMAIARAFYGAEALAAKAD